MSTAASTGRNGRWGKRVLALLIGCMLTPFVLEGALRIAGLFVEGSRAGSEGESAILCQGDSFTFGLFLPPEAAYPARLEQLLKSDGRRDARVVNAGIPSKPTWIVKRELRADLRRWKPGIVLLLAGVNDHWRKRPDDHAVEVRGRAPRPWRIVATWQMIAAGFARRDKASHPPQSPAEFEESVPLAATDAPSHGVSNWIPTTAVKQSPGVQEVHFRDRDGLLRRFEILAGAPSESESCGWIEEDMTTAVAIAREEGVTPVLLLYPGRGGNFDPTNAALARVAEKTDTLLVDPRPEFDEGTRLVGREALFFPDSHATDKGCEVMARVTLRELTRAGLVRVSEVPLPLAGLEGWKQPRLAVSVPAALSGGRPTHVRVEYAPGYGAVLVMARAVGVTMVDFPALGDMKRVESKRPQTKVLPLADDELLRTTLDGNQFRTVTLGVDGCGEIPIPWELVDAAQSNGALFASVAIVLPKVGPVLVVSEAIEVQGSAR